MNINFFSRLLLWGFVGGLTACSSLGPVTIFRPSSPHEQYAGSLRTAKLDQTALGTDWLAAGNRALSDSLRISIPYRESGYFAAQKPFAIGYRIDAQRGDKLLIRVDVQGQRADVFIDVFELNGKEPALVAASKADTATLTWDVRRTQTHLIRIQPELLRSGQYTISITREPLLSFPVQGRDSRQISSYFGQPREGGKRRHEGIDIFAPRGTPAIASIDGVISGVGENRLGGNVVWLSDTEHNQRLYYAHLDRFNVTDGQRVAVGDTIGFVGNTGNARTTGPHLHFGIYAAGEGALNPLAFVRRGTGPARQPMLPATRLNDTVRTTPARSFVRLGPDADSPILSTLPKASALTITGGTAAWMRVELPNGLAGYLAGGTTETTRKPLRRRSLTVAETLMEAVSSPAAPIKQLPAGATVEVLGVAGGYQLVKDNQGVRGWLAERR